MSETQLPSPSLFVILMIGLVVAGCEEGDGNQPEVPTGQFNVQVEGAITDTLSGPVYYRMEDQKLVGLELGNKNGPGLSIELEPRKPSLQTYEVVSWELFSLERTEDPPGAVAFLTIGNGQFQATAGTFEVTYVSEERVGATFDFRMEGAFGDRPRGSASVWVTGSLNATDERTKPPDGG